jgi:hypothetical protein
MNAVSFAQRNLAASAASIELPEERDAFIREHPVTALTRFRATTGIPNGWSDAEMLDRIVWANTRGFDFGLAYEAGY